MNHMPKLLTLTLIAFMLFLFASCQTVPQSVDSDWSEEMFFKQAQEAIDNSRLTTALFYYEVFLVRYPENHEKVIAAEYERAILYKKLGAEDMAIQGLKEVLDKYENSPYVILYPPRYEKLATKVLAKLEGREVEAVDPDKYPERQLSPQEEREREIDER